MRKYGLDAFWGETGVVIVHYRNKYKTVKDLGGYRETEYNTE